MQLLTVPQKDHSGATITGANAGCTQRVDLPNGDVLLPIRYWRDPKVHRYTSVVARCGLDGKTLTYKEHGTEHTIPTGRGLYEPSLAQFKGRYFLTLRANGSAYVTRGKDGIRFEPIREWKFDDGKNPRQLQHATALGHRGRRIVSRVHTARGGQQPHHAPPRAVIHRAGEPRHAVSCSRHRTHPHPRESRHARQLRGVPCERQRKLDHLRRRPPPPRQTQR